MAALEGLEQRQILPEGRHPGGLEEPRGLAVYHRSHRFSKAEAG
jgi:hypothetical protein